MNLKNASRLRLGFCTLTCLLGLGGPLAALEKMNFAAHPFFKLLIGKWKSEGALKKADGDALHIAEEWTGKVTPEGEFVMQGSRLIGDEKQEYTWSFSHNAGTGLVEATHSVASKSDETKRFEASVSEVDLTMELKLVGDGGSSITIKDSFAGDDHSTLESVVTLTGGNGEAALSGKITHKRVKEP